MSICWQDIFEDGPRHIVAHITDSSSLSASAAFVSPHTAIFALTHRLDPFIVSFHSPNGKQCCARGVSVASENRWSSLHLPLHCNFRSREQLLTCSSLYLYLHCNFRSSEQLLTCSSLHLPLRCNFRSSEQLLTCSSLHLQLRCNFCSSEQLFTCSSLHLPLCCNFRSDAHFLACRSLQLRPSDTYMPQSNKPLSV